MKIENRIDLGIGFIFLSLFSLFLIHSSSAWSSSSDNYTSSIAVVSGGGILDTNSSNYRGDVIVAQAITGSTNSSLFSTVLGFFFGSGSSESGAGSSNNAPSLVTLTSPTNGSDSSINRTQILIWQEAADADEDSLTYDLNVTRLTSTGEPSCSVNSISETGISGTDYTTPELCVDDWYSWKVRAYDETDYGTWSDIWNFSVASYLAVSMSNDDIDFGVLSTGDKVNTTSESIDPFGLENTGNVKINFTIYANNSLWNNASLNTTYFQYKSNFSNEDLAFDNDTSQMNWANLDSVETNLFNLLDYNNSKDVALIDILIEVPENETGGSKTSTIVLTSSVG